MSSVKVLKRELEAIKMARKGGATLKQLKQRILGLKRESYKFNDYQKGGGRQDCVVDNPEFRITIDGRIIIHNIYEGSIKEFGEKYNEIYNENQERTYTTRKGKVKECEPLVTLAELISANNNSNNVDKLTPQIEQFLNAEIIYRSWEYVNSMRSVFYYLSSFDLPVKDYDQTRFFQVIGSFVKNRENFDTPPTFNTGPVIGITASISDIASANENMTRSQYSKKLTKELNDPIIKVTTKLPHHTIPYNWYIGENNHKYEKYVPFKILLLARDLAKNRDECEYMALLFNVLAPAVVYSQNHANAGSYFRPHTIELSEKTMTEPGTYELTVHYQSGKKIHLECTREKK